LSPGRRTNRENFRSCQRTKLFLLLLFLESIKKAWFYLLKNQSSAARPQPGAAFLVQSPTSPAVFTSTDLYISVISYAGGSARKSSANLFGCENPGKNLTGSRIPPGSRLSRWRLLLKRRRTTEN
jgi:hypothetical protein